LESLDNKCPACGAKIFFNPTNQLWDCQYCGSKFTLDQMKEKNTAANNSNNTKEEIKNIDVYQCKNCGAQIMADENTTATFCVYCGSVAILKNKINAELPNKIIPFKLVKEEATKAFQELKKGRPLMPNIFTNKENIEKITGIYIPFWQYDLNVSGNIDFDSTDTYTWSDYNYYYTQTKKYLTTKSCDIEFNGILADGSSRFDDDLMDCLEPFNFNDLVDYNNAYLAGFLAEKYDVNSDSAITRANSRAINSSINEAKKQVIHQTKIVKSHNLNAKKINQNYIMLPVWLVNVNYKNKNYLFAMNGQTGKMIGNIPVDIKKAILLYILIFCISFIILIALYLFVIVNC